MNILFITYEFPPKGGPGVQRPLQTARLLESLGSRVTVLTVKDPPTAMLDEAGLRSIPSSISVARAWSLEPTRLLQLVRGGRRSAPQRSGGNSGNDAGYSGAPSGFIRFVQAFFFPDEKVGWTPWAMREARRLHAAEPFDVILASGPPFTAFRIAWKLSARLGIPWVADVRDPMVDNYFFQPHTPLHAQYKRSFERRVVERASLVVAATPQIERDIVSRNPSRATRIATITNGFDPADFAGRPDERDPRYFNVNYVGSFQGDIRPDTFLEAVYRALERDPSLHHELRVRMVGNAPASLRDSIRERGLAENVSAIGFVAHDVAVREMSAADALLLVLADAPHQRAVLTGKLPEYLGAGRPVLALVPEGAARDVLDRAHAAWIVEPGDVDGAADALIEMHQAWRAGTLPEPDPAVVAEFDRTKLVARLSVLLEQAVLDAQRSGD